MTTSAEYALLAAYANSPMPDSGQPENSLTEGTGGQDVSNFVPPSGWTARLITLDDLEAARPGANLGALSTSDLAGMAAFVFTRDVNGVRDTVLAFRGTQSDEGGLQFWQDAITDIQLSQGEIPQQVIAAYYFYQAALALPGVAGSTISLTGHSLGGALASIIADYTGGAAVVFDPAPSVAVANALRSAGADDVMWGTTNVVLWPEIPPATANNGSIIRINSAGDPITQAFEDNGGGMLGITTTLPLNFDRDVFSDSDAEVALGLKDNSLHSIHLLALQQQDARLGAYSTDLLDLMTQVFNPDVNLKDEIANLVGVPNAIKCGGKNEVY